MRSRCPGPLIRCSCAPKEDKTAEETTVCSIACCRQTWSIRERAPAILPKYVCPGAKWVDRTQKLFFQTFAKNGAVAIFQLSSAATNDRSFNGETNTVSIPMQAVFSIAISKKNLHTAMGQRRHQGNHIPPKPRNSQSVSLCPPLRIHNQKPKILVTPLAAQSSHTSLILSRDGINLSNTCLTLYSIKTLSRKSSCMLRSTWMSPLEKTQFDQHGKKGLQGVFCI